MATAVASVSTDGVSTDGFEEAAGYGAGQASRLSPLFTGIPNARENTDSTNRIWECNHCLAVSPIPYCLI